MLGLKQHLVPDLWKVKIPTVWEPVWDLVVKWLSGEKKETKTGKKVLILSTDCSLLEYVSPYPSHREIFPSPAFQKPHVVSNLWMWIMRFIFLWFNIMITLLCTLFQLTEMKQYIFFKILCPLLVIFPFQICSTLANERKINLFLIWWHSEHKGELKR